MLKITTTKESSGWWLAQWEDNTTVWARGTTPEEAIGRLILLLAARTNVESVTSKTH